MFTTVLIFIAILSVLVFVHELGHFVAARKFGVKVSEFGLGFPPRGWGFYKNKDGKWKVVFGNKRTKEIKDIDDTLYSINLLPLGGFVAIKGENGATADEEKRGVIDDDNFIKKPIWQRSIILSAGVGMNVLLAAVLFSIGFMIGLPQIIDEDISPKALVTDQRIQITDILADSPANIADIKRGDIILSINDNFFEKEIEVQEFVDKNKGKELNYNIRRGSEEFVIPVIPVTLESTGKGGIGVAITEAGTVKYPFHIAIFQGFLTTFFLIWAIVVAFFDLIKGLVVGAGLSANVAGPVGIATVTGEMVDLGFIYLMQFTALLSANLAVVNFLPFPALDGGRILFLIIEKIKGSPVKRELEATLHYIGFALLMILILLVTFKDIARI